MITTLAGGVGAARLLVGMAKVIDPAEINVIANTGDDTVMHGLHISPDIDTLIYTLSGAYNQESGWGLADETWNAMDTLERYGGETWFRLGDRDLGTHLYRTARLAEGASLAEVTQEITRAWGLSINIIPMTNSSMRTIVTFEDGESVSFQDYFVRLGHSVPVAAVRFKGVRKAAAAPGVISSINKAEVVVIAPSNPIVSIGPILALPEISEALSARRDRTVAISPIVAGKALKGPAAAMMAELGHEASVVGVARAYEPYASVLIIDHADADLAGEVEEAGMKAVVTRTVMDTPDVAAELSKTAIAAV